MVIEIQAQAQQEPSPKAMAISRYVKKTVGAYISPAWRHSNGVEVSHRLQLAENEDKLMNRPSTLYLICYTQEQCVLHDGLSQAEAHEIAGRFMDAYPEWSHDGNGQFFNQASPDQHATAILQVLSENPVNNLMGRANRETQRRIYVEMMRDGGRI